MSGSDEEVLPEMQEDHFVKLGQILNGNKNLWRVIYSDKPEDLIVFTIKDGPNPDIIFG